MEVTPPRLRLRNVPAPDGSPLTVADLPAPDTKRWVIRRKAEVIAAVRCACSHSRKPVTATCSQSTNCFRGKMQSIRKAWLGYAPHASSDIGRDDSARSTF